MSHPKRQISAKDSQPIYLQYGNYRNGIIPPSESQIKEKNATNRQQTKHKQNKLLSSVSDSRSTEKRCHSTPAKKFNPNRKYRQPSRVSNHERQIITQKLHEIDELRSKIIELQWALSSHEDICAFGKRSSCFGCLKRCSKKVESDLLDRTTDYSKMTLDQMSTEVVFNSSRESLPKFCDKIEKPKQYRKRKKDKRSQAEKNVCEKHSNTKPKVKNTKENANRTLPVDDKQPKITNNNTIVLPELYSSNKSSTEEIINLASKLDAQNNEIRQIKISLQECLELLRLKQKKGEKSNSPEKIQHSPTDISKYGLKDYIYLNQRTPSILTNYMKEREVINFMSPNPPQVFTCNACDSNVFNPQPPPPPAHKKKCGLKDCQVLAEPQTQLTVRKAETCQDKKKNKKNKKKCSKCCAKKSQPRVILVKYTPTRSTVTNTSGTNVCGDVLDGCYRNDLVMKVSPLQTQNAEKEEKKTNQCCPIGKYLRRRRKPSPDRDIYDLDLTNFCKCCVCKGKLVPARASDDAIVNRTETSVETEPKWEEPKRPRKRRRRSSSHRRRSRSRVSQIDACYCPGNKGRRPCPARRRNCFIRCLLCMFCMNL